MYVKVAYDNFIINEDMMMEESHRLRDRFKTSSTGCGDINQQSAVTNMRQATAILLVLLV